MLCIKQTIAEAPLRRALHQHLARRDPERDPRNIHASEVTKEDMEYCARAPVLKVRLNIKPKDQFVTTAMAVTWEWGRLVEWQVREWFAELDMAVGDWRCLHKPCGRIYGWCKRPKQCQNCKGEAFEYSERRALSAASGIGSGIDLMVDYGRPLLELVEVKSIDKEKFAALEAPLSEHRRRTKLYLRGMSESEDPVWKRVNQQRGRVLYVSKGGYGVKDPEIGTWGITDGQFSPFKEYVIERDDADVDHLVDRALAAREGMAGGAIPPRLCKALASPRAQKCPVMDACWKMAG